MFSDLLESLRYHLWRRPQVLIGTGNLIVHVAVYWFLAGLLSNVVVQVTSVMHAMLPRTLEAKASISDVLPVIPTWWIPESTMSFLLLIVMGAIGVWLALTGKRLRRLYVY